LALKNSQDYKKISILYGFRNPKERLFQEELESICQIGENVELLETVDKADDTWAKNEGVITTLIPKVNFDPQETIAVIVGPPIMYKFVLKSLIDKCMPKENIYMSLERQMKCGVGKCGHCQINDLYTCMDGPVFNYAEVSDKEEVF
jgi:sulfhydrogenase subunit gamma (sulfur reductase)